MEKLTRDILGQTYNATVDAKKNYRKNTCDRKLQ